MSNVTAVIETASEYDHQGAALYIAVILIWYSTGLAMMLFLQVRPRTIQQQFLFDSPDASTKKRLQLLSTNPFASYRNVQADSTTKQILNELKDRERRERLWKIYYASAEEKDKPHSQYYQTITSDSATIDRINRKLAEIHRMDVANDDSVVPLPTSILSNENRPTTSASESTKFFSKRFPSLRRPNGGATTNPPPTLFRVQSEVDTKSPSNRTVEMEPLVSGKPSPTPTTANISRKRNKSTNRFIVEKVPTENSASTSAVENSI